MASFNNCTFSGNLGKDPDLRYFEDGKMVANFNLAVEGRKGQTLWIGVKVWGKPAQVISDYVRKGSRLIVSGELQEETWERDGEKKSRISLNCQNFIMLDSRRGNSEGSGSSSGGSKSAPKPQTRPYTPDPIDEEAPF